MSDSQWIYRTVAPMKISKQFSTKYSYIILVTTYMYYVTPFIELTHMLFNRIQLVHCHVGEVPLSLATLPLQSVAVFFTQFLFWLISFDDKTPSPSVSGVLTTSSVPHL